MLCRATQDKRVMVETSDKMWSTGGGNGKPLQYSCCENSMSIMKRQKDVAPEDVPPRSESVQYSTGEEQPQPPKPKKLKLIGSMKTYKIF